MIRLWINKTHCLKNGCGALGRLLGVYLSSLKKFDIEHVRQIMERCCQQGKDMSPKSIKLPLQGNPDDLLAGGILYAVAHIVQHDQLHAIGCIPTLISDIIEDRKIRLIILHYVESLILSINRGLYYEKYMLKCSVYSKSSTFSRALAQQTRIDLEFPSDLATISDFKDARIDNFTRSIYILKHFKFESEVEKIQQYILYSRCAYEVNALFTYTKNHPECKKIKRNIFFDYLVTARDFLVELNLPRPEIKIFEVIGKPGLGKTKTVSALAQFLQSLMPVLPLEDMLYVRSKDFFWNGYRGQPIILYDDISHTNTRKSRVDFVDELISIGSGVLQNPPMAFEKDTKFTSIFCIITSNFPIITTVANPDTASALKRRIISLKCSPFMECAVYDGSCYRYVINGRLLNTLTTQDGLVLQQMLQIHFENDKFDFNANFDLPNLPENESQTMPKGKSKNCDTNISLQNVSFILARLLIKKRKGVTTQKKKFTSSSRRKLKRSPKKLPQ